MFLFPATTAVLPNHTA